MGVELSNSGSLPQYDRTDGNEELRLKAQGIEDLQQSTVDKVREAIAHQSAENDQRRELSREEMHKVAETFVDVARTLNRELQFTINHEIEETVVTVIDRATGETVRQIPSEEVVRLAQRISELNSNEPQLDSATGFLVDSRV